MNWLQILAVVVLPLYIVTTLFVFSAHVALYDRATQKREAAMHVRKALLAPLWPIGAVRLFASLMTDHCHQCPFRGCDGCAYQGTPPPTAKED